MKRIFYRLSIIFPLLLIYYSFTESVSFSIPELGVYLEPYMARFIKAQARFTPETGTASYKGQGRLVPSDQLTDARAAAHREA